MKNYVQAVVLAVLIALSAVSLRQSVAAIGGGPVPIPNGIGGGPVPIPNGIGGGPVPIPNGR